LITRLNPKKLEFNFYPEHVQKRTVALQLNGARAPSHVHSLFAFPPKGYRFVLSRSFTELLVTPLVQSDFWFFKVMHPILRRRGQGEAILPINYLQRKFEHDFRLERRIGDLVYAWNHLVFDDRLPWVVDLEYLWALMGYNQQYTERFAGIIKNRFEAESCKAILCHTDLAANQVKAFVGNRTSGQKVYVVRHATTAKNLVRDYTKTKLTILFVGTRNQPNAFDAKGGKEAVQAFIRAKKEVPDIQMIVRSDIPSSLRSKYARVSGLSIIDQIISESQLDALFRQADIFIFPSHITPAMVLIEAMSYGLPIITTDEAANGEIVRNMETGIVTPPPRNLPKFEDLASGRRSIFEWERRLTELQEDSVERLASALVLLASDSRLRKQLGEAAKAEVDFGKYSITARNNLLTAIFDQAVGIN
jgi:glycosyltransferase involved in cell wall biosynthesis